MTINLGSYTIVLTIVCYLTNFLSSYSQVSINPPKNENNFSQLIDVFPIDVQANYGVNYQIIVNISNNVGVLVHGISPVIEFRSSNLIISSSYFNQFVWEFDPSPEGEYIRRELRFSPGIYLVDWILATPEGIEITRSSKNISINNSEPLLNNKKTKNKNFTFNGNAQINLEYGSRAQMYSNYPNWAVTASLTPTISIYEVPVNANFMYTNISSPDRQSPFVYSLGFDSDAFKRVLTQRLLNQLKGNKNLDEVNQLKEQTFSNIKKYDQIINNPEFKKELEKIEEIDKLKNLYKSYNNLSDLNIQDINISEFDKLSSLLPDSLKGDLLNIQNCELQYGSDSLCKQSLDRIEQFKNTGTFNNKVKNVQDSLTSVYNTYSDILPKVDTYKDILEKRELNIEKAKLNGWIDGDNLPANLNLNNELDNGLDINNTDALINKLTSLKLLKKYEKYLMYLKTIQFGTIIKRNSDFTLNYVPLNGVGIELFPKNIYVSFLYGQILRPVFSNEIAQVAYKRKYIGGSVGYGSKESNHVHLTINHSKDNPNSLLPRDSVIMYFRKPGQNNQIGLDFSWSFWKKRIKIYGEVVGSQFIRDVTLNGDDIILNDSLGLDNSRNWFINIFKQKPINFNTTVDYAYKIYADLNLYKGNTKIVIGNERVGPNFYSFGNPFLLKDMFILDASVTQSLFKGKLKMKAGLKSYSDNLANSGKLIKTSQLRWLADLEVRIPKMPTIKITYMPIIQQNDSGFVNMNVANSMISYNLKRKKFSAMYSLGYIFQKGVISYSYGDFESQSLILNQMYTINKKVNFFNINSIIYSVSSIGKVLSYNLNIGFQVPLRKLSMNMNANILMNQFERRIGGALGTSFNISRYLNWNIQLEYFYYKTSRIENLYYPQYDRISLRSIWNINW